MSKLHIGGTHRAIVSVIGMMLAHAAWAAETPISSVSVSVDQLRYSTISLVDATTSTALSGQGSVLMTGMVNGLPIGDTTAYPLAFVGSSPSTQFTSTSGDVSLNIDGSSVNLTSRLLPSVLSKNSNPYAETPSTFSYPTFDASGNLVLATVTNNSANLSSYGNSGATIELSGNEQDPSKLFTTISLAPHSALIMQGNISLTMSADRTQLLSLANEVKGFTAPAGFPDSATTATNVYGQGSVHADIDLSLHDQFVTHESNYSTSEGNNSFVGLSGLLSYDLDGFITSVPEKVSDLTMTVTTSKPFALTYVNSGDIAKEVILDLRGTASTKQGFNGYQSIESVSFGPYTGSDPFTPGVPEPGTYALMSLGLFGLFVARRQANRK